MSVSSALATASGVWGVGVFQVLHWIVGAWWVPALLASGIIWWAFNSFSKFKAKIEPLKAAVQGAIKALEELQSARDFTRNYEVLTPLFTNNPILGPAWAEFESTLILPTDSGFVRNTRRPSEYFNEDLYYKGGVNLRDFESVPNQLVGIGLLFTFLGLVASLLIAKQGIGADIAAAKIALGELLNAAAFKFVTSIAALGSSVVYLAKKNRLLHEADELIEQFCRELERLTAQVTSESLAEDARKELVAQTAQLERFNSELAVSIAEALDVKLQKSLGVAMEPIAKEIGNLAERLGQINQDALTEMVDRFSSELSGAAREHTDQMAKMLQSAAESIADVPRHIDEAGERFSQQIHAGAEELGVSMTAAAENMDAALQGATTGLVSSVDAAAAQVAGVAAAMEGSVARQAELAKAVAETEVAMFERLQSVLATTQETAAQLSILTAQVSEAGAATSGLTSLAAQVAHAAEALGGAVEKAGELSTHTEALNAQAGAVVERLAGQVAAVEREIASMNNALSAAFEKVAGGVGQFGAKTGEFVQQLDKDLADAVGRLSGAVVQLDEVLGEMPKKADFVQLSKAINAVRARAEPAE